MNEINRDIIGTRLRELRKRKGYTQTELANLLGKSLRTVQKYENGEIEISIAMINELAKKLDTTATYLLGNKSADVRVDSLADIMGFFFYLEKVIGLHFEIDVKRPPHNMNWQCALIFDGKKKNADFNADICLFLEEWKNRRDELFENLISSEIYDDWKDKMLAYYSAISVEIK